MDEKTAEMMRNEALTRHALVGMAVGIVERGGGGVAYAALIEKLSNVTGAPEWKARHVVEDALASGRLELTKLLDVALPGSNQPEPEPETDRHAVYRRVLGEVSADVGHRVDSMKFFPLLDDNNSGGAIRRCSLMSSKDAERLREYHTDRGNGCLFDALLEEVCDAHDEAERDMRRGGGDKTQSRNALLRVAAQAVAMIMEIDREKSDG